MVAARQLIADGGFAADTDGIRAARQAIMALPVAHPAHPVIESIDFYSLSGCRDLLFHVQEHRFTLPQIAALLAPLALEFLGFEFESAAPVDAYRREFPGDACATSLENWQVFESQYPQTFAAMYQFWVRLGAGRNCCLRLSECAFLIDAKNARILDQATGRHPPIATPLCDSP